MIKVNRFNLVLFSVLSFVLVSCGRRTEEAAVKHLTMNMPKCDVDEERANAIWKRVDGHFSGDRDLAYYYVKQISMAPKPLLNFIISRIESDKMTLSFNGTSRSDWIGETFGGFDGSYPTHTGFQASYDLVRQSALHEMGHAISFRTYEMQSRADEIQDIQNGFQAALQTEGQNIWSYAKSSRYEWFASAFSHYMCSKVAREDVLKEDFPSSYKFISELYSKILSGGDKLSAKVIKAADSGTSMIYVYVSEDIKSVDLKSGSDWLPVTREFDSQPSFDFIRGIETPETLVTAASVTIRITENDGATSLMTLKVQNR